MILFQIGMGSPGLILWKIMSPSSKKRDSEIENALGGAPLCNQTVNLKTDSKTLYYSLLEFKYIPSILKHNKG